MAFDDLLQALRSRAEREIAGVLAAAREQATAVHRESDRRCAERSAVVLREHTNAIARETERAVAEAVRVDRQGELAARVRARDRVLSAARAKLARVNERPEYQATLPGRFAAAIAAVGDAPARVRCGPPLAPPLGRLAIDHPSVRVDADPDLPGGFLVETVDGRVVVDEVLERRLAGEAEALGQLALSALDLSP